MKRHIRLETLGIRHQTSIQVAALLFLAFSSFALTENNPYSAISGRNTFALKPPPPLNPVNVLPPPPPPNITLQGISTILGRAQVLLKVKIAPKPPEAAKELSLVMDVGQREGEVEVMEIDAANGAVKIRNQGTELSLNMKDNADKPLGGPAMPAFPIVPAMTIPGLAPMTPPPAQVLPTVPGVAAPAMIPTRPVRAVEGAGLPGAIQAQAGNEQVSMDRVAGNVALYEANRLKNEQLRAAGVRLPKMPVHTLLQQAPSGNQRQTQGQTP